MKFFPIFFIVLFNLSTNCSEGLSINRNKVSDSLIAIKVSRSFPLLTNDGKLLKYENDEAYMFYLNDFILHKQPYTFKFHKLNKDGIYDVEKEEIRNSYFVYKRGSLKGFFTDSSRNLFNVEFKTDSILNRYWYCVNFAEGLLDSTNFEANLILKTTQKKEYAFRSRIDTTHVGTAIFKFSNKFPIIDYSLFKEIDTLKNSKLIEIDIINNSRFLKVENITIDEVKQSRKLEIIKDFDFAEIKSFFLK